MLKSAAKLGIAGAIAVLVGRAALTIIGYILAWTVGLIILAGFLAGFYLAVAAGWLQL